MIDHNISNTKATKTQNPKCTACVLPYQASFGTGQNEFRINLAPEMMVQHCSRKRKGRTSINSVPPFLQFVSVTSFDVDNLRSDLICHYCLSIMAHPRYRFMVNHNLNANFMGI